MGLHEPSDMVVALAVKRSPGWYSEYLGAHNPAKNNKKNIKKTSPKQFHFMAHLFIINPSCSVLSVLAANYVHYYKLKVKVSY